MAQTAAAPQDLPEILTVEHLMLVFGRSREWVRELLRSEDGPPAIKRGRSLFVRREDFQKWAKSQAGA